MKKSTPILSVLFLLLLNGCGSAMNGIMTYNMDPTLKSIKKVQTLATRNAVGFEWDKIMNKRVHGVNVYRSIPTSGNQSFERIGSTSNHYSTHYVDTHVEPSRTYLYTFTTFTSEGEESKYGTILNVRTLPHLPAVSFAKAYVEENKVVKILWAPHSNESVDGYLIERAEGNGAWEYLTEVEGQLSVEHIDTFVLQGRQYKYRVFAKSYDDILSLPSPTMTVSL